MSASALQSPPAAVNAAKATDTELAACGIPPRPRINAELQQKWQDAFGGAAGVVAARLAPSSRVRSHPRIRSVVSGDNSGNWSGVVVTPPAGDSISVAINGVWNVPQVTSLGAGQQLISVWIGVDGDTDPANLLQAGITAVVNPTGAPVYSAWAEWLTETMPIPPQEISNFPVSAGDSIEVQIWMSSPTTATVAMRNLSANGAPVIAPVANPANAHIAGLTAEWIVERPALSATPGAVIYSTLADYSPVVFTEAIAWAQSQSAAGSGASLSLNAYAHQHGFAAPASALAMVAAAGLPTPSSVRTMLSETATISAGSGSTIAMVDENGTTLSAATILSSQSLQCQYAGPPPS
jgi:hypothetical protein